MSARNYHWHRPASQYRRSDDSRLGYYVGVALIVSLAVHAILWFLFGRQPWDKPERLILTEKFRIEQRGTYDPKALAGLDKTKPKTPANTKPKNTGKPAKQNPALNESEQVKALLANAPGPEDFAALIKNKEIRATPATSEIENAALPQLDLTEDGVLDSAAEAETANKLLESLREQGRSDDPNHPTLAVDGDDLDGMSTGKTNLQELAGGGEAVPEGYASLDQVLGLKGDGDPGKPIWVPTDTLFDFNSADLREEAKVSLMKLGAIIMQRKNSDFILEGHTDLFGSDAYNDALSRNRALAIRNWLVESLQLDPNHIRVRGLGRRNPRVQDGDIDAQALNRRVEVVIQPRGRAGEEEP